VPDSTENQNSQAPPATPPSLKKEEELTSEELLEAAGALPWQRVLLKGIKSPWWAIIILCLPGLVTLYYDSRRTNLEIQEKQLELERRKALTEAKTATFAKDTVDSAGSLKEAIETLEENQNGLYKDLGAKMKLLNSRVDGVIIRLDKIQYDGLTEEEALREKARLVLGDAADTMEIGQLRMFVSFLEGNPEITPVMEKPIEIKAVKSVRVPVAAF